MKDNHIKSFNEHQESLNISVELEELQKELKDASYRYVYGKDPIEQTKANYDMMIILNKIRKLKDIEK